MTGPFAWCCWALAAALWWWPDRRRLLLPPTRAGGAEGRLGGATRRRLRGVRRRRPNADDPLPVLRALRAGVRAGLPPATAVALALDEIPDPTGRFDEVREASRRHTPLAPAWAALAGSGDDLALVARVWRLSERHGTPLADGLDLAIAQIGARRERQRRLDSALAGPRASALVLTVLPLAGPLIGFALGSDPMAGYASAIGAASTAAGLVLLGVGRRWARWLVERVARPEWVPR